VPLFSGSYEGASFFELLRHDFPHLLPFEGRGSVVADTAVLAGSKKNAC
jgi:hypothetical protein